MGLCQLRWPPPERKPMPDTKAMTPADKYAERAKEIAAEGHCRYCDNARIEPVRLECARDIQDTINDIARALEQTDLEARMNEAKVLRTRFRRFKVNYPGFG